MAAAGGGVGPVACSLHVFVSYTCRNLPTRLVTVVQKQMQNQRKPTAHMRTVRAAPGTPCTELP